MKIIKIFQCDKLKRILHFSIINIKIIFLAANGIFKNSDTTFNPSWSQPDTTSETWYPANGNQLNNEVDEPNQLGLTKPRNGSVRNISIHFLVIVDLITFVLYTLYI